MRGRCKSPRTVAEVATSAVSSALWLTHGEPARSTIQTDAESLSAPGFKTVSFLIMKLYQYVYKYSILDHQTTSK